MKQLLGLLIICVSINANACGNEYGVSLNGERLHTPIFYLSDFYRSFDKDLIQRKLNEANAKRGTPEFDYKIESNIALYYMKLGETKVALGMLESLAAEHPEEYAIAANLGTAYELDGQLHKALQYIKKGYSLNPESHYGSEWIHIKILEAKIKHGVNSNWFRRNPIITVEELLEKNPDGRNDFRNHLAVQIRTRVPFTPAPNAVIANLLRTYAEYCEEYSSYENALMARIYVLEFENVGITLIRDRQEMAELLNKVRSRDDIHSSFSPIFKDLLETGEIDPNLLIYAVDTLAFQFQAADAVQFAQIDSLELLKKENDSLKQLTSGKRKRVKIQPAGQNGFFWGTLFGTVGVILGIVIATISNRRKK